MLGHGGLSLQCLGVSFLLPDVPWKKSQQQQSIKQSSKQSINQSIKHSTIKQSINQQSTINQINNQRPTFNILHPASNNQLQPISYQQFNKLATTAAATTKTATTAINNQQ